MSSAPFPSASPAVSPRSSSRADELDAGDVIDDFQILSVLARSGMGSVCKARHQPSGRIVALKVPHMCFESDVVFYSRFLREEAIGLRLDHPAIVKVLPLGDKSRPYLVMEYVEGESLWRTMRTEGRLPLDRALDVARQIGDALAYMHRAGVVHRDLKPENIVVDPHGRAHIVDFGIALDRSAQRITWGRLSTRLGTPEYMAPEQIRGKRGDGRVDVYALGLILYEMLAAVAPYGVLEAEAVLRAKRTRDATPLADVLPGVDPDVAAVVMRAIEREPEDRFATAGDLVVALADPSCAAASIASERRSMDLPRPRPAFMAAIGVLCVLAAGFVWLFVAVH